MINLQALSTLVELGESETIEFKRSTGQLREGVKSACAILNGQLPGFVFFGVGDRGTVVGQDTSTRTHEEIANELRRIEPPTFPDVEAVALDNGKSVIALRVPGGTGLFTYDDRRLLEHLHGTRRWENEPVADGAGVGDLDTDELYRAVDNAICHGRLEPPRDRHPEAILRGFQLMHGDQLLNAAVVLFGTGSRLPILYPQFSLRLARFRGLDRLADFEDNRQYWDHAYGLLRRAEAFLLDHVPVAGRIRPGRLEREDYPRYPSRATREALANAFCHRDYSTAGGAVTLAMYDNRLEIANPGRLRFGLTTEDLFQPHESRPWNPLIANVFYRTGIIERWGTGTLNILAWCQDAGAAAPRFQEQSDSISVTFTPAPTQGAESGAESLDDRILRLLVDGPLSKSTIASRLGRRSVTGQLNHAVRSLLERDAIAYTVPNKPRSRLQRYRLTEAGAERLKRSRSN